MAPQVPSSRVVRHYKAKRAGEIVDFYGACDETPTSTDQILALRRFRQLRFGRDYMDK
ncbi:MAG: hypothetical protein ACTHLX_18595 [Candidatus Binatia bacterium]